MIPIIIDTDPGIDDALAIMLAVKSKLFDIKAITTVAGNTTIENTTRNARYILKLLNSDIPVYSGSDKPLKKDLVKAVVHGPTGLEGLEPDTSSNLTNDAVDRIIELIKKNKNITLITLGPLTNIAKAIKKAPEIMKKLDKIVIMGGAIDVPGNKNGAEFNFYVDPDSARIVLDFPVKKYLIPLDLCNKVPMQLSDFENITGSLKKPVLKMIKPYIDNIYRNEGVKAALMYDPLTVYYCMKNCKTKEYFLSVDNDGKLLKSGNKLNVVENIDKDVFVKDFINILCE